MIHNYNASKVLIFILTLLFFISGCGGPTTISVTTATEALQAINQLADTGGIIQLADGDYNSLYIEGVRQTEQTSIVIQGSSGVRFTQNTSYGVLVRDSSYILIRDIVVTTGLTGIGVQTSQNIIIEDTEIFGTRQAGIHVSINSSHVDIINNHIHDTGVQNPQYAEGIYVGTGGSSNFPDVTTNVWIEGNLIERTGIAEAINIKPEVLDTTLLRNVINEITPGDPASSKYNQAAITIEGGRGSDPADNYDTTRSREVWVQENVISNVIMGRWGYGIMVGGTGVYVIDNTINDAAQEAVYANNYGNLGLPIIVTGTTTNGGVLMKTGSGLVIGTEHGVNPNSRQEWSDVSLNTLWLR